MRIPIGISNRHIHLSQADANTLFGTDYSFISIKELSQPGQYAYQETLTIQGPKGSIGGVRVLGPHRKFTQLEIMMGDNYTLGINAPIRESGDLKGSAGIKLIGPQGEVNLQQGVIVAQRHIHLSVIDAQNIGVINGQRVKVQTFGTRPITFEDVIVRVRDDFDIDMHIDIEEANAAGLSSGARGNILVE